MKRFVEGTDRSQCILFPEHLDDYVAEDNIVRIVEAFIEALDLKALELACSCLQPETHDEHHGASRAEGGIVGGVSPFLHYFAGTKI
jgi:hypothetical protein